MRIFLSILIAVSAFMANGCAKKEEPAKTKYEEKRAEAKKAAAAPIAVRKEPTEKITKLLYAFEHGTEGWEIPDWALEKPDHVAKNISISKDFYKEGASSLRIEADFPGKVWTGALVEIAEYLDLEPYREISCDVYLPGTAPEGLKAKLILTVGESWKFTEMSRSIMLMPGKWVSVKANISPGSEDWKATVVDDYFRKDIRKIVVRIESNRAPVYAGPIYIDNIAVSN